MQSSWMNTPIQEFFLRASYVEHLHSCNRNELMCGLEHLLLALMMATLLFSSLIPIGLMFVFFSYVTRRIREKCEQPGMENLVKLITLMKHPVVGIVGMIIFVVLLSYLLVTLLPPPDPTLVNKPWPPGFSPFHW